MGRSKPVATAQRIAQRRAARAMSTATRGVAVAVDATTAARAELRAASAEPEVVGPEVVAPLGDAVRLVDHEQARRDRGHPLEEPRRREALGRHVEQAQLARRRARWIVAALAAPSCWALTSATRSPSPRAPSASTWSCMSATSGETTTVRSSRSSAGSW